MELPRAQFQRLGLPSRCRSLLFGIVLGLLISGACTSSFAGRIVPNPLARSWIPRSPSSNASISSQFYILFFRSGSSSLDRDRPSDGYVSAVDSFPETAGRNVGSNRTTSPGVSSSTIDRAQDVQDDAWTNQSPELENREKRVDFPQEAYDPSVPPSQEQAGLQYSLAKGVAKAEGRAIARLNGSFPADSSAIVNEPGNRRNFTRPQPSATAVEHRRNLTRPQPSSTTFESNNSVYVNLSALIKGSNDRRNLSRAASSTVLKTEERLPSPSRPSSGHCDLSLGNWVADDSYPLYKPGSCPFVDEGFNCRQNGRPDAEFSRWRWMPRDCTVPRMNGTEMLERLRGKRLVFVGDSLNRNQWESLLCILWESLPDKSRLVELHGGRISKLPGAYVFKFLDYDCKLEFYTSHFLVEEEDGPSEQTFTVRLDRMDRSERRWRKANVLVFNTGHWWTPDKIGEGDNRFREGARLYPKLDITFAYRKAIGTWARWVEKFVDPATTRVFFRGYSPLHYIGGQWNSGGQCHNETQPIFNESFLTPYPDGMKVVDDVISRMSVRVQNLNITRLSDFRKDAHPAIYGHQPQEIKDYQDCSHWCLPGLPDTWNELLSFSLFRSN